VSNRGIKEQSKINCLADALLALKASTLIQIGRQVLVVFVPAYPIFQCNRILASLRR
jgi:hypothetical protein